MQTQFEHRALMRLIHEAEKPGSPLLVVPLTNSELPAVLEKDTYERLRSEGLSSSWFFNHAKSGLGYVKARLSGKADVAVARHIQPPHVLPVRFRVQFRNGESRDLRRSNIDIIKLKTRGGHPQPPAMTNPDAEGLIRLLTKQALEVALGNESRS